MSKIATKGARARKRAGRSASITNRERILRAAMDLFGQNEYGDITGRDIAAEADVSTRLIWHHFGSKEALRAEIDDRIIEIIETAQAHISGTVKQRINKYYESMQDALAEYGPALVYYYRRMLLDEGERGRRLYRVISQGLYDMGLMDKNPYRSARSRLFFELLVQGCFSAAVLFKPHFEKEHDVDLHDSDEFKLRIKVMIDLLGSVTVK